MFIHLLVIGFAKSDEFVAWVRVDVLEEVLGLLRREVEAAEGAVGAGRLGLTLRTFGGRSRGMVLGRRWVLTLAIDQVHLPVDSKLNGSEAGQARRVRRLDIEQSPLRAPSIGCVCVGCGRSRPRRRGL